jgi:Uma2 family endonuclease
MTENNELNPICPETYLEVEKSTQIKHEYINGIVCEMPASCKTHILIALNLAALIRFHLRGSNSRVFISDMKVELPEPKMYFYPDIVVTSDPRDLESDYLLRYPKMIIEVLSKDSAAFDRGEKFALYRGLECLQQYVLVDTQKISVDVFRRSQNNEWILHPYSVGEEVYLNSIDFHCEIESIYEDVLT